MTPSFRFVELDKPAHDRTSFDCGTGELNRFLHYPVPVMLIAQLAIDNKVQGQGLGKITLIRALQHCYEINRHLPSYAVVVDARDGGVQVFYTQYGFKVLDTHNHRIRLFLPMKIVAQLFPG